MSAIQVSTQGRALLRNLHVNVSLREYENATARELIRSGYAEIVTGKLFMTGAGRELAEEMKRGGAAAKPGAKPVAFPGSREAFRMLQRLAAKGVMRNYNDALAEQLTERGYARVDAAGLVPTEAGRTAAAQLGAPPV
ncbi:hypothetical protein ACUN0C_01980 [Faunimonas sp. B44]|uniref:hypothetical protein n=1 Tax=Faunimonas sp. B44 TaxID=3461493 RepID=UPI004044FE12